MVNYSHRIDYSGKKGQQNKRMYRLHLIAALILLQFHFSCQETELPQEIHGEVEFYAEGNMDGQLFSLEAGVDDYYMASSFSKNDQELLVFQGTFIRPSCKDCGEELSIEIYDKEVLPEGQSPDIEEALKPGNYSYRTLRQAGDIFVVDFSSEGVNGSQIDSVQWDFGDGTSSTILNPQHTYINPEDLYPEVCLKTIDEYGCLSLICNRVNLDSASCKVDFSYQIDSNTGFVSFRAESEGVYPLRYQWNFGDGYGATLGNPGYYFGTHGDFQVCLTVLDAMGCQQTVCKNIGTDPGSCNSNFKYKVRQISEPVSPQLSGVRVQWTDKNGKIYRSDLGTQNPESYFEILSSKSYDNNERGEATRQLALRFQCKLFAEDEESIDLDITEAQIAVAYP